MNSPGSLKLVLIASFFLLSVTVLAQGQTAEDLPAGNPGRVNVLQQLGLSPAQMQQIRRINQARRPAMQKAQQRVREASRRLDEAIYADVSDEAEVQNRLKEFQQAQAEVSSIRFTNEFAIRNVLNSEQLARFRTIRQQFAASAGDAKRPRARRNGNIRNMMRPGKRPL